MKKEELRKILRGKCISDESCEAAISELLDLFNVIASATNKNWAKMRHDACLVREAIAIKWMLETWCDVEVTDELTEEAINEFRSKHSL